MNILLGTPTFSDWSEPIGKLQRNDIYFNDLDNVESIENDIKDKNKNISLIIPLKFEQMKFIIENKNILNSNKVNIICCDSYDTIDLLDSKCRFIKFMISNNFTHLIPKVHILFHDGRISMPNPIRTYPIIFKFGSICAGGGSKVCHSAKDLSECTENSYGYDFIVQEYINDSTEYSGHMFIKNGIIVHAIYYKTVNENKFYIQHGRMREYTRVTKVIDFSQDVFGDIFKLLNYTGFACVDFKIINNNVKIFEINPRFGGTLIHNKDGLNEMLDVLDKYY